MTKKKTTKPSLPKLNVDLKKYLDHNLAKDNLKLIRQLEKANDSIAHLEDKLKADQTYKASKKDKEIKNISDKIQKIYNKIDLVDFKEVQKDFKNLLNINNLALKDVIDLLYTLVDFEDGSIQTLLGALPDIIELLRTIEDYLGNLDE